MARDTHSRRDMLALGGSTLTGAVASRFIESPALSLGQDPALKIPAAPVVPTRSSPPQTPEPEVPRIAFARSDPDEEQWSKISDLIRDFLTVTENNSLARPLSDLLQRVETCFEFAPEAADEAFNPLHIEPLLDQAADLLDRGIRDRATWDDLSAKALNTLLELNEYRELQDIHRREEASGLYDVDAEESARRHQAEVDTHTMHDDLSSQAHPLLDLFNPAGYVDYITLATRAAAASGLAMFLDSPGYADHDIYATGGPALRSGGFPPRGRAGRKSVSQYLSEAALQQSSLAFLSQFYQALMRVAEVDGQRLAASSRVAALLARTRWEARNAQFRRERTVVNRRFQELKCKAATDDSGILNYTKRLPAIRERFCRDFRNSLARLKVIERGFVLVYGYNNPLPTNNNPLDYFDACLDWAREAIHWLIRFSRQDQNAATTLSLRELMGIERWQAGLKNKHWIFTVDHRQPIFESLAYVRVRGLSAVTAGAVARHTLELEAILPRKGIFLHVGQNRARSESSGEQIVSPCRLGRVREREHIRQPDIVGISALHNATPFGQWEIRVLRELGSDATASALDDIQLDLTLAFQHVSTAVRVF